MRSPDNVRTLANQGRSDQTPQDGSPLHETIAVIVGNLLDTAESPNISHIICLGNHYHQEEKRTCHGMEPSLHQSSGLCVNTVVFLRLPVTWNRCGTTRKPSATGHCVDVSASMQSRDAHSRSRGDELIGFTTAELVRRVGRAGCVPGQTVFRRLMRLLHSLFEDDLLDP